MCCEHRGAGLTAGFTVCVNEERREHGREFLRSDHKHFHAAQATQKLAGRDGSRERKSTTLRFVSAE